MIVQAISGLAYDPEVALVEDARIVFALEEEWVTCIKGLSGFPEHAFATALTACSLKCRDIGQIAFYWYDLAALLPALVDELRSMFDPDRPTLA